MSCPYIVTSEEGTSYCKLAEAGVRSEQALADDLYIMLAKIENEGSIVYVDADEIERVLARYRAARQ